ncbi:alpha/beta hydrolase [bacterium]|nr:alpha/beta hydrolase [bacterium]
MKTLLFLVIFTVCACATNRDVDRTPSAEKAPRYRCAKFISMLFSNPYKKTYSLQKFKYKNAIKAFHRDLDARAKNLKIGSIPFIRLQTSKKYAPTVVLLHGYSDSPASMREISKMYYERGYHVIAPLYNDHGLKTDLQKDALDNSSLDRWREDVDFAVSVAQAVAGKKKVHVAGYSMGATLAMDLSWRHPGLIASRTLFAPLFKEEKFVIQIGLYLLNLFTDGSIYKEIDETSVFYKRMTYKQTIEMHRLTRQVQPHLLKKKDNIPTAVFRVDPKNETTVDDSFIDAFVKEYGVSDQHYIYHNPQAEQDPVLHRDFTSARVNSSGRANPALDLIFDGLNMFLDSLKN